MEEDATKGLRSSTLALWLILFFVLPLPLLGLDGSFVPTARFGQLGGAVGMLGLLEGMQGMVGLFVGLLLGHALVYALALLGVCLFLRRLILMKLARGPRWWVVSLAGLLLVAWVVIAQPYDTQFHHSDAHASLFEIYF